jgi:hypothetical protein
MAITVKYGLFKNPTNPFEEWKDLSFFEPRPIEAFKNRMGLISMCPAHLHSTSNYFEIRSPIDIEIEWRDKQVYIHNLEAKRVREIVADRRHEIGPIDPLMCTFYFQYLFWCEEKDVILETVPAFFEKETPPFHVIPGRYNIHRWRRPVDYTIEFKTNEGSYKIKRGDPLFYVKFTSSNIYESFKLQRTEVTEEIKESVSSCIFLKNWCPRLSLKKMYDMFTTSKFYKK